jgi:two-component system, sensor histidine kinase and response regulator
MDKFKVLAVDDEPGICSGIKRVLSKFTVDYPFMDEEIGFSVQEAADGETAINIIRNDTPDIVLLDNKLPGIQGIDVLDFINKEQINTWVIMITSYASLDLAVKATKQGAYDFVPKPFTPQELRSSIENVSKQVFLKRMTQQLNKQGKRIRFQFLSLLSHELKAPINAVEGYLTMMQEKTEGDDIDNYSTIINRSIERIKGMQDMIMDLLDLTNIESGKKQNKIEAVDIVDIARDSIDKMQPYAIQKEVNIKLEAPENLYFDANKDEMEIIINNLLSNGIKYNKKGGSVICSLTDMDQSFEIKITDTGIGISDEDKSKLFREFSRIRNEQTKRISGSGLGLSIVKKIAAKYGGKISVKSDINKGSTFAITFNKNKNHGSS